MATFTRSDDLGGSTFVDADLRGARFVETDLSGVVMRGVQVDNADIDAPWLPHGGTFLVNGVDVIPFVEAELNRRFPGRADRRAGDPEGLRAAWATLERTWATTLDRVAAMPAGTVDVSVGGESHAMRVLMSTTYDASGATINQCTATRVVCQNTLRIAHGDARAAIKTRHSTKFDAAKVGRELAQLAQGFAQFKAIGDAMAGVEMSAQQISEFFKTILEIPFDAKKDDVSSRKMNQFSDLSRAYSTSVREGAEKNSVWAALQAVTRYADHDRPR